MRVDSLIMDYWNGGNNINIIYRTKVIYISSSWNVTILKWRCRSVTYYRIFDLFTKMFVYNTFKHDSLYFYYKILFVIETNHLLPVQILDTWYWFSITSGYFYTWRWLCKWLRSIWLQPSRYISGARNYLRSHSIQTWTFW